MADVVEVAERDVRAVFVVQRQLNRGSRVRSRADVAVVEQWYVLKRMMDISLKLVHWNVMLSLSKGNEYY